MLLSTLPRVLSIQEEITVPVNIFAMENQVKELTSLINELYEAREEIPTACTTEKDEADYQIKLLKTSIDNLNKFITLHRTALNKSIEDAVKWYGQTAPEWFTK